MKERRWKTRAGRSVAIGELPLFRISNGLKRIIRSKGSWRKDYLHDLIDELEYRGVIKEFRNTLSVMEQTEFDRLRETLNTFDIGGAL